VTDRPFIYICSPFRGDIEANIERARGYCRQVFDAGYHPVCPHIYFPQFLRDSVPEEREAGMMMGETLLTCFCQAKSAANINEKVQRQNIHMAPCM
jgi:dienelactone hydrolase